MGNKAKAVRKAAFVEVWARKLNKNESLVGLESNEWQPIQLAKAAFHALGLAEGQSLQDKIANVSLSNSSDSQETLRWLATLHTVFAHQWNTIDRHRLSKYLLFVRRRVRTFFSFLLGLPSTDRECGYVSLTAVTVGGYIEAKKEEQVWKRILTPVQDLSMKEPSTKIGKFLHTKKASFHLIDQLIQSEPFLQFIPFLAQELTPHGLKSNPSSILCKSSPGIVHHFCDVFCEEICSLFQSGVAPPGSFQECLSILDPILKLAMFCGDDVLVSKALNQALLPFAVLQPIRPFASSIKEFLVTCSTVEGVRHPNLLLRASEKLAWDIKDVDKNSFVTVMAPEKAHVVETCSNSEKTGKSKRDARPLEPISLKSLTSLKNKILLQLILDKKKFKRWRMSRFIFWDREACTQKKETTTPPFVSSDVLPTTNYHLMKKAKMPKRIVKFNLNRNRVIPFYTKQPVRMLNWC